MTFPQRIYRLGPVDSADMQDLPVDPSAFVAAPDAQSWHVVWSDAELGLTVGVWDSAAMQEAPGPYPGDEFVVLLDGALDMRGTDGSSTTAGPGDGMWFRDGAPLSWVQSGYLRKLFFLYDDPRADRPDHAGAAGGVGTLTPDLTLTDAETLPGTSTPQRDRVVFENDHGNMQVGVWDTQELSTPPDPFPWHEFGHVLEGEATLTEADGTAHTFRKGDTFFIPKGTVCAWEVPSYLRKFYATLDPDNRPGD